MIGADATSTLPPGWARTTLGSVVTPSNEKIEPSSVDDATYLGLEHVEAHTMRIVGHGRAADVRSTKSSFSAGDVLYGKLRPYLNKVAIPDFSGICSTDFLVFGSSPAFDSDYLAGLLSHRAFVEFAHRASNGVELPRVSWRALSGYQLALPPIAEQRRIAERLDEVRHRTASTAAHIKSARDTVERLRAAVRAAACGGRLTADFRRDAGAHDDFGPPGPFSIPASWSWTELGSLLRDRRSLSYGILKPGEPHPGGVPMLRVVDIGDGIVHPEHVVRVSPELADEYRRTRLERNDIVLAVMATIGRAAIVPAEFVGANVNRALAVIKFGPAIDSRYALTLILSPFFQETFAARKLGSAQARINLRDLRTFAVPLPPLEEQAEIVRRTDALLAKTDRLASAIAHAEQALDRSWTGALTAAFRGELVPTEASLASDEGRDFESADCLLERVEAERASSRASPRRRIARV